MQNVLLISDNEYLIGAFRLLTKDLTNASFAYAFSKNNKALTAKYETKKWIVPLDVKEKLPALIEKYDLIISLHCKQIFPSELVKGVRCINVHPGLNPFNRGWYPQVFSILNGMPCGATIHEIDEGLDHGNIICQKEVALEAWDTSYTIYQKVLAAEIALMEENLQKIMDGEYQAFRAEEGNLNLKKDFEKLLEIDLGDTDTFQNHIDKLRALSHGNYDNAFFYDRNGTKVYVKITLKKEEVDHHSQISPE